MILTPLTQDQLHKIFDDTALQVMRYYINKALFSQPEPLPGQGNLPIQVPKEHLEQWVVQAIGGTPVGAGSYPVDVIKDNFGADVKMLSCKLTSKGKLSKSDSGETSLAQNFQDTGTNLDQLFKSRQYKQIIDGWRIILGNKLEQVANDHPDVDTIYYIFILRADTDLHLCGCSVDINKLNQMKQLRIVKKSVFIDNFIDSNYGNAKIYKAKKRLELRLRPRYWVDNNMALTFSLTRRFPETDLRQKIEEGTLSDYQDEIIRNIFIEA